VPTTIVTTVTTITSPSVSGGAAPGLPTGPLNVAYTYYSAGACPAKWPPNVNATGTTFNVWTVRYDCLVLLMALLLLR
jgi:hypothetical protein